MKRRSDSWYFSHSFGGEPDLVKLAKQGLDAMQSLGATLVPTDTGNPFKQNFKFLRSGAGDKTTDATAISRVVPPEPPDVGICATLTGVAASKLVDGRAKISHGIGTGKPFIQ